MDGRILDPKVLRKLNNGFMTVADLIQELQGMPQDAYVGFQADYGDYTHTQQFLPIGTVRNADDDNQTLYPTAYTGSGLAIHEADEGDVEDAPTGEPGPDDVVKVVILG